VKQRIVQARRILVVSHVNPDGDAIGSLTGLGLALRSLGKSVTMACPTSPLPASLTFVPGSDEIVSARNGPYDLIIVLDSSGLDRVERLYDAEIFSRVPVINIDHHVTNANFGGVNWVDANAAAASEMVLALVQSLGVRLDAAIGTCLLTGITTDTLGFRTSSTTSRTLRSAADLMDAGASLPDIVEQVYNAKPLGVARVWGEALGLLEAENGLVWTSITGDLLARYQTEAEEVKGLVSFLRGTQGTDIAVLFVENGDGRVKVEFRASRRASVAELAARLGGGGHRAAAGCTVAGPLDVARRRVLGEARRALSQSART
jgi:phosphoesterase RecJ-like protein